MDGLPGAGAGRSRLRFPYRDIEYLRLAGRTVEINLIAICKPWYDISEPFDGTTQLPAPTTLPLDDQLCFALYSASMAVTRTYKPLLDRLGLTYPQYLVLHTLWEADGRSIGAIAERLDLESSTVTPLVKRLETAGFVTRRRNPADERQVVVALTKAGLAMREACACLGEALLAASGMSLRRIGELNAEIRMLREALATRQEDVA